MDRSQRVAVAMFVVGVVVAAAILSGVYLGSQAPSGPFSLSQKAGCPQGGEVGPPPLGVALNEHANSSQGPNHWVNFSILNPCTNLTIGELSFNLTGPHGVVTFPTGEGLEILRNTTKVLEATDGGVADWIYQPGIGPNSRLYNNDELSIFWSGPAPATIIGDALNLNDPSGSSGTMIT